MEEKKEKILTLKEYPKNNKNPYLEDLTQTVVLKNKRVEVSSSPRGGSPSAIVNLDTGEIQGEMVGRVWKQVDPEQFTKIFLANIHSIFGLRRTASRVLAHIMRIVKPNNDFFYFDIEEFLEGTGYSTPKSVFDGLSELVHRKIIARSNKHYKYFINPAIFFNGNRASFITTIEKVEPQKSIE